MRNRSSHVEKKALGRAGLVLAAGIAAAATAWAAPTNVTSERTVVVGDLEHGSTYGESSPWTSSGAFSDGAGAWVGGTHPYPGYPDFTTHEWASATQKSLIDGAIISGTGEVGITFSVVDADLAFAKSSIDVWFDLATAHSFALNGTIAANMDGGLGLAMVKLDGPTSFLFKQQGWHEQLLAQSGTLAPGSYHLSISSSIQPECAPVDCTQFSWMGGASSYDVTMQITAVPEPGTVAMLLAGLGVLGLVARRKGLTAR